MKEVIRMWKYGTMVALAMLCAGIYMLFLLPTKSIPIIPGITEIRPASILPVIFGLLFGPAGAWGSAIGNLCGDFFGTLSGGSLFGFIGNFMYSFIPYKLWRYVKIKHYEDRTPTINSPGKLVYFGIIGFISSAATALIIAWGLDLLGLAGFTKISIIITLNNAGITLIAGPLLLPFVYSAVSRNKLLWTDIMHPKDISNPSRDMLQPFMITTGSIGGLVTGLLSGYLFAGQKILGQHTFTDITGKPAVALSTLPFLLILFYGSFNS